VSVKRNDSDVLLSVISYGPRQFRLSGTVKKAGGTRGYRASRLRCQDADLVRNHRCDRRLYNNRATCPRNGKRRKPPGLTIRLPGIPHHLSTPLTANGRVELYSSDGRQIALTHSMETPRENSAWDFLNSDQGLPCLRITINGETVTRSIVRLGEALYIKMQATVCGTDGNFSLNETGCRAAVDDSLIASKTGYKEAKVAVGFLQ